VILLTVGIALLAAAPPPARPAPAPAEETRITLDFKDADILDVMRLMADAGDFQLVADPGISCKLTLKLKDVALRTAFDVVLRSCGLGSDEDGGIVRVAPTSRLLAERTERRRLAEEQALDRPLRTRVIRLSYAKAAEASTLLKGYLSARGSVVFDPRTNTLFVTDIE
jgi:type IV pilus assembly protein PilQ